MAFVQGPVSFYILRFLLGVAEAGFAPGVLLYLTYWFPAKERGRATALFMTATVLSIVVGAPFSGWLMDAGEGLFGLHGWQAMFILEGIPAVLLGVVTFFYLVDSPEKDQRWLTAEERAWLMAELAKENQGKQADTRHSLKEVFSDYRVWLLTLVYMFNGIAVYGVIMWLPQIVKSLGDYTAAQTGLISAIPFVFAAIGLVVISRSSDRTGERKIHTAIAGLFGGIFLAASALAPSPIMSLVLLSVCAFSCGPISACSGRCRHSSCPALLPLADLRPSTASRSLAVLPDRIWSDGSNPPLTASRCRCWPCPSSRSLDSSSA